MLDYSFNSKPIVNLPEELWPLGLANIPCPPDKLNVVGLDNFIEMKKEGYKFLTVVGSRNFTDYGERVCRELLSGLAGYPVCIVSGLAYGIDSIAHRAALEAKLPTIGFPGSGLDSKFIYPSAHLSLSEEMINQGGCLISEFDHNRSGLPWMFPQRNRLMVGISDAVLIIEAAEKSGSGITANMTIEYDHNLLAVPGSIFNHNSKMTNRLIRSGASLVTNSSDILEELGFDTLFEKTNTYNKGNLNTLERSVLNFIQNGLTDRDEILKEMKIPVSELNRVMSKLEMEGLL